MKNLTYLFTCKTLDIRETKRTFNPRVKEHDNDNVMKTQTNHMKTQTQGY